MALVVALFATGAFVVGNALASAAPVAAQMRGHGMDPQNLPPELASLKDVPAGQRFQHFQGLHATLTDKDGKPINIAVTPGVATSVNAESLTISGNDGSSHTYTLNDQTWTHGQTVSNGQQVVVVTLNDTSAARAVLDVSAMHAHN
jgi:hypothetical protein